MPPRGPIVRTWTATGLISLGVVVVCVLLVSDGDVSSTERWVFRAVNDLPDALESPMVGVQYAGVAIVPFVVAADRCGASASGGSSSPRCSCTR